MRGRISAAALALVAAQAAAQDRVVHVYNWTDYIAPDTIARFEAETGIKVVYDVYDSNEVLEAKLLAGSSGYDVVVPTSSYLRRQVQAGLYAPLDPALLPNLKDQDPRLIADAAYYDPENAHSAVYLWGTNGIGYNVAKVAERLGEDTPVNSWSLVFDPSYAAKLADCGISFLDSWSEMFPLALNYLGLPPDSTDSADLEKAAALLEGVRPYVRYFHSSQYISDLANGEICVAVGWSGDVFIAMERAEAANTGAEIAYAIPEEGSLVWFDLLAIPKDAPHPAEAHAFIDFVLRPENIAAITDHVYYPNANLAALDLVDPEIRADPAIYPPSEVMERLFPQPVHDARADRAITRLWTRIRTGQ